MPKLSIGSAKVFIEWRVCDWRKREQWQCEEYEAIKDYNGSTSVRRWRSKFERIPLRVFSKQALHIYKTAHFSSTFNDLEYSKWEFLPCGGGSHSDFECTVDSIDHVWGALLYRRNRKVKKKEIIAIIIGTRSGPWISPQQSILVAQSVPLCLVEEDSKGE